MYASRIEVNYAPQVIKEIREIILPDGLLTIKDISKHLRRGEKFTIIEREAGWLMTPITVLIIHGHRLETDTEVAERVAKEIKYNENFERFHAKRGV